MAVWHLRDIRNALEAGGWLIVAEHSGDGYQVSGSWEIIRSTKTLSVFIDFEGLDDMTTLPIEQSYACRIRGDRSQGLYLRRKGDGDAKQQERWRAELKQFTNTLEPPASNEVLF